MFKPLTRNFWYDLILRSSYFKTLGSRGLFNEDEISKIKRDFKTIIAGNSSMLGDSLSEYHLSWSSAILATYRACIGKNMEKDGAIEFAAGVIFEHMRADSVSERVGKVLDRSRDPFRAMIAMAKIQEEKFFGNTFTFVREIDNGNRYRAVVKRCFYNDFFRKNNAPELMRIACRWDLVSWSKGIVPERHGVRFSRPVTLGLDDKECPFDFERVEKSSTVQR